MSTEPSIPDEVWRDPSFQQLPVRDQLTCARCGQRSVIFDLQDDGALICRRCADRDDTTYPWTRLCEKRPGCHAMNGHDGPHRISAWEYE